MAALGMACFLLTGCESFDGVAADRAQMWLWGFIPAVGYLLLGGLVVFFLRRNQLRHWNLIEQSVDPGTKRIALGLGGVIFALAIVFVVLNVQGQIADQQKYLNVGLWFVGSIAGGVGALMFGLTAAEPKSPVKTLKTSN